MKLTLPTNDKGKIVNPLDFMSKEELRRYAYKGWLAEENKENFIRAEDGSKNRFEKTFKNHYGWWLVHNLIAHVMIGIMPVKPFFRFHDYTSRKMRS